MLKERSEVEGDAVNGSYSGEVQRNEVEFFTKKNESVSMKEWNGVVIVKIIDLQFTMSPTRSYPWQRSVSNTH